MEEERYKLIQQPRRGPALISSTDAEHMVFVEAKCFVHTKVRQSFLDGSKPDLMT